MARDTDDQDEPSDEERALFRDAVGSAQPLIHNKVALTPRQPPPVPYATRADEARVKQALLSEDYDPAELETGEELSFYRPGLQRRLWQRLRRGQLSVESELDLHGMTVTEAQRALADFLHECRRRNQRCVRIIHGKGHRSHRRTPVLKHKLNSWLPQREEVLAYRSARPVDGGTGAVYVLLKRG